MRLLAIWCDAGAVTSSSPSLCTSSTTSSTKSSISSVGASTQQRHAIKTRAWQRATTFAVRLPTARRAVAVAVEVNDERGSHWIE